MAEEPPKDIPETEDVKEPEETEEEDEPEIFTLESILFVTHMFLLVSFIP